MKTLPEPVTRSRTRAHRSRSLDPIQDLPLYIGCPKCLRLLERKTLPDGTRIYTCSPKCGHTQPDPAQPTSESLRASAPPREPESESPHHLITSSPHQGFPRAFVLFHDRNPHIYEAVVKHARELKRRGFLNVGVRYLFEHQRYTAEVIHRTDQTLAYALDNNIAPYYGRLIEHQEPDLRGFFRMRSTRAELAAGTGPRAHNPAQAEMEFD